MDQTSTTTLGKYFPSSLTEDQAKDHVIRLETMVADLLLQRITSFFVINKISEIARKISQRLKLNMSKINLKF